MLDVGAELLTAFGPHLPRFSFLLDDLSTQTDAELRGCRAAPGTAPRSTAAVVRRPAVVEPW